MKKESYENGLWIQNKSIVYRENIDDLKKSQWNTIKYSFNTPINKRCNLFVVIYHIILQLLHSFLTTVSAMVSVYTFLTLQSIGEYT